MTTPGTTTPTLAAIIEAALAAERAGLHVSLPGKVLRYNSGQQTADVELQVNAVDLDDDGREVSVEYPNLPDVPVAFVRSSTFHLTWEVKAGDRVAVHFASQAIDQYLSSGQRSAAADGRRHSLAHAWCVPGLYPVGEALSGADNAADTLVLGRVGGDGVRIAASGITIGADGATEAMVLGDALKTWLETHTHPTGTGPSGPPVEAANLTTTLSTKHKVD